MKKVTDDLRSVRLLLVLISVAHGLAPEREHTYTYTGAHLHLGSLRSTSNHDRDGSQKVLLQANSRVLPPKNMPTVVHMKDANGDYKQGSPLYNTQEGLEEPGLTSEPAVAEGSEAKPAGETAVGSETGHVVVYGMGATVMLLALTFAMANNGDRLVSNFTWGTLDNVISIFLAVLVFQALDEVVYDAGLIPKSHFVLGSFIYAMALLLLAVGLSYALKGEPSNLAIFVASSAHFVAFGFMHAATLGFEHHSSRLSHAIAIFLVVLVIIGGTYTLSYYIKKSTGMLEERHLMEKMDDLENDAGAMAASMAFTIVVCYLMTNEFQDVVETEAVQRKERLGMLFYAIGITAIGSVIIVFISGLENSASYVKKRLGMFCSAVLAMCAAWAWLLWGRWKFHESASMESTPMFSRIIFATCASLAAMAAILILAKLPGESPNFKKDKALALLTVSLVAGMAWEETFDAGLEVLAQGHEHRPKIKIFASLFMLAIVLPVHVIYFKPIVARLPREDSQKWESAS